MPKLFMSYRRRDTQQIAGRIVERLSERFGVYSIFFDIDSIPVGDDYREHINESMRQCHVLLALIGENWLENSPLGQPRIMNTRDPVRIEIESAFENRVPVIPVVIGRANMPEDHDLPSSFENFSYLNAARIDPARDFTIHMDRLIIELDRILWPVICYDHIQEKLKKIDDANNIKLSEIKNDASMRSVDREFLSLMWQIAAIDNKRQVLMDALIEVDKKTAAATTKFEADYFTGNTTAVSNLIEKIFADLEDFNHRKDLLDNNRKEIQKPSVHKSIWR
jgi:hypothetical protein